MSKIIIWNYLPSRETWITWRLVYLLPISQFARNLDLILTLKLNCKIVFLDIRSLILLAFGLWIHEFTKYQSRLRCDIQICDLKLSFSWEIYFIVSDVDHELDFLWLNSQRKKWNVNFDVVSNNSWYISGENFAKHFLSTCKTQKPKSK